MIEENLVLLPTLNALLNFTSAALATAAWVAIRRGVRNAHIAAMVGALVCSTLFLVSYLVYHFYHGTTRFEGPPLVRAIYLAILLSHTLLAAAIVPMIAAVVVWAVRGKYEKHRRLARWTLPLWLYVSVTGIVVYAMLYHIGPSLALR